MSGRPLISNSFTELVSYFEKNKNSISALKKISHELQYRNRNRSLPALAEKVTAAIAEAPEETAAEIRTLEREQQYSNTHAPDSWDPRQRTIIELDEYENNIVEAGPGTGKTAVACARVAYLVEECDLESSKILLVSFTRTAVKEIRNRIEAFAETPRNVSGLRICTLDSFTWQALRGAGDDAAIQLTGSYETSIKAFKQQLEDGNTILLDYLEEIEHLVLDEGQDLVGDRAELTIELIKALSPECGVTVFADSAQAIYGFTSDSDNHGSCHSTTVVERLQESHQYDRIFLEEVHRTSDPKLTRLFLDGRKLLLDRKESDYEGWSEIKELITSCSHGTCGKPHEEDLQGKADHLVLYRTRAEVLIASGYLWSEGIPHKIRMSGLVQRIPSWIGRVFGGFDGNLVDREQFNELWKTQIADADVIETTDDAWQLLMEQTGDRNSCAKVARLREILSRERPPIDFIVDESMLAGPVIGTIHASKGREANQVNLMLPPDAFINTDAESPYLTDPVAIAEEERVLFVGATRARNRLMIGKGVKTFASSCDETGRVFKSPRNGKGKQIVEFGLTGDIDLESIVDGRLGEDTGRLQDWLWENRTTMVDLEIRYSHEIKARVLYSVKDEIALALISKQCEKDLWYIAKCVEKKDKSSPLKPSLNVKHIRMTGVSTHVIPESQRERLETPWRHSGFILAPVITGFSIVYFNSWKKKH